nr:DoxX family protein [Halapricum sp. CBA1109]
MPGAYEQAVPPQLPWPRALVYLSGVAEVVLGAGVLFERTRRQSAWGLIALLVAVFPANVYMAVDAGFELPGVSRALSDAALWARLPMQAVLVAWAWWYTDATPESGS